MLILILGFLIFYTESRKNDAYQKGKIKVEKWTTFYGKDYESAEIYFSAIGFKNMKCIDLEDEDILHKDGTVYKITIAGMETDNLTYEYFYPDDQVTIMYH